MFRRNKKKKTAEIEPVAQTGAYRIKLDLYQTHLKTNSHWWQWNVFDTNGGRLAGDQIVGVLDERNRERALNEARKWIDSKVERDRLLAEAEEYEEWYGETPEVMQKTITTQDSYIRQLEAKIDEYRRDDGVLDVEAMTEGKST